MQSSPATDLRPKGTPGKLAASSSSTCCGTVFPQMPDTTSMEDPLNQPVLDEERWQELATGFSAESLQGLVRLFLQETPLLIASLQTALAAKEAPSTQALAHQLKGSSATVGAARLSQLADHIEERAICNGWDGSEALPQLLDHEFAQLQTHFLQINYGVDS